MKSTGLLTLLLLTSPGAAETEYRKPPQAILDALDVPETPHISVSPAPSHAVLAEVQRYPSIEELAEPMLRLAGVRINPQTNGPRTTSYYSAITVADLADGSKKEVALPAGSRLSLVRWSPDGERFAFLRTARDSVELWVGVTETASARRLESVTVNAVLGAPPRWMPDSRTLLVQSIPASRGGPPAKPEAPDGPVIQESKGRTGPVRTYQDLLENEYDAALFDYYATAQLTLVDAVSGRATAVGKPGIFREATPAPDGGRLLIEEIVRPYSYLHPYYRFPYKVEVWDRTGKLLNELARLPLADNVPIEGVPGGPRSHRWKPTAPATVVWVEALDGGDPRRKVPHRDRLMTLEAPFSSNPKEFLRVEQRFMGLDWLEDGDQALVSDYDRDQRWLRTFIVSSDGGTPQTLWSRSIHDAYGDPGAPVRRTLPNGHSAIAMADGAILLIGQGASPQGDRPFLDRFVLSTQQTERLFHCAPDRYEIPIAPLSDSGGRVLTRREAPSDPPNYLVRDLAADTLAALTDYDDPQPQLRSATKRLVTYERNDGVALSFTLYLPPGYREGSGEALPTVFWAYPREYSTAQTAGQVRGSDKRFTFVQGPSHLFFLLQGYAILDGATLPVVGDPETANDTYVEQIVAGARAAIEKAAELGVTDPNRVGAGGHSYGAFMTANLLAHSDLFRAGIARSGAYNRTLTPFGFQAERRTLWEASDIYFKISPFMSAQKINEPLLLIHGADDNNAGTFPIQSERMYHAIAGNGGVARLVMLPHESHGYAARESIEHTLAEMIDWFEKHVRPSR